MKKLFSGCCCPIVYYKQFLIVGKKGLTIYKEVEPNVFEEYFHTSKINKTTHRAISGYYSSVQPFTNGMIVRNWLAGQSFNAQYEFGINVIKMFM